MMVSGIIGAILDDNRRVFRDQQFLGPRENTLWSRTPRYPYICTYKTRCKVFWTLPDDLDIKPSKVPEASQCLALRLESGTALTRMSIIHISSLSQLDKLLGNKDKLTVSRIRTV